MLNAVELMIHLPSYYRYCGPRRYHPLDGERLQQPFQVRLCIWPLRCLSMSIPINTAHPQLHTARHRSVFLLGWNCQEHRPCAGLAGSVWWEVDNINLQVVTGLTDASSLRV